MKLAWWIEYFNHYKLFSNLYDDQLVNLVQIEQVVFQIFWGFCYKLYAQANFVILKLNWTCYHWIRACIIVRLNLINHVLALFHYKFACNTALRNLVFRWESCKGSVWKSVKKCSRLCSEAGTRGWISREARGLQATKSWTRAEHAEELNIHATWSTTGQKSRIAIKLACGLNSRLSQVVRLSCQPTLF